VSCALRWAFVPSPGTWEGITTDIQASWAGTAPAVIYGAVDDVYAPLLEVDAVDSCLGPSIDGSPVGFPEDFRPLNTCGLGAAGVMAFWLPMATVMRGGGALFAAARILLGVFGAQTEAVDSAPSVRL